ncbi:MAG: type II toxin-antitoxin system RelE/ParE family toxin [Pirellulales bacterium]|nr:type II toxin-antitoxin system RelE/ParE family toxin [Pirellulales bacterium]
MAKLIWSEEAIACLRDIDQFVAETSRQAAISVVEGIIEKVEMLGKHPRLGAQLIDISEPGIREVLYGRYRIVYRFEEPKNMVYVLAIIHSAMDIERWRL